MLLNMGPLTKQAAHRAAVWLWNLVGRASQLSVVTAVGVRHMCASTGRSRLHTDGSHAPSSDPDQSGGVRGCTWDLSHFTSYLIADSSHDPSARKVRIDWKGCLPCTPSSSSNPAKVWDHRGTCVRHMWNELYLNLPSPRCVTHVTHGASTNYLGRFLFSSPLAYIMASWSNLSTLRSHALRVFGFKAA